MSQMRVSFVSVFFAIAIGAARRQKRSGPTLRSWWASRPILHRAPYQYRADRKPEANPPESWIGLMKYASLPFDKPVDVNAPALKKVLCGLIWEEVRRVPPRGARLERRAAAQAEAR